MDILSSGKEDGLGVQISHQAQAGVCGPERLGGEGASYSAWEERRSIPPYWPEL